MYLSINYLHMRNPGRCDAKSTLLHVIACAVKWQAIVWADVDPDRCRHIMSLVHNEFTENLCKKNMIIY